jgi:hypothetical protein
VKAESHETADAVFQPDVRTTPNGIRPATTITTPARNIGVRTVDLVTGSNATVLTFAAWRPARQRRATERVAPLIDHDSLTSDSRRVSWR